MSPSEWNGMAKLTNRALDKLRETLRQREQHSGISVYFHVCFCLLLFISVYFCSLLVGSCSGQTQPLYCTELRIWCTGSHAVINSILHTVLCTTIHKLNLLVCAPEIVLRFACCPSIVSWLVTATPYTT